MLNPSKKVVEKRDKDLINNFLLEKISLVGIARSIEVKLQINPNTMQNIIPIAFVATFACDLKSD